MLSMWVTHGMHACMPCKFSQSIKTDRWRKREEIEENEKKVKEKENEEGRSDSFFLLILAFRRSKFVRPRVKVGYALRGRDFFPTLVNFYLIVV